MDAILGAWIDAVILDPVLKLVFAVGKFADFGPHALLGVFHQRFAGSEEAVDSMALEGMVQSPFRASERANHRVEIAPRCQRRAMIGEDDLAEVFDMATLIDDFHRRQPQPLLI